MLGRLLARFLQPFIIEMVDKRFKEKMYERYYESKQKELQERIKRLRNNFPPPAQRIQIETKREKEPSTILEVPGHSQPRVRKKTAKVNNENWYEDTMAEVEKARKKREEQDSLKAKLNKKTW